MAKSKAIVGSEADFTSFKINKKIITVNGVELPFKIGDKIKITAQDTMVKTVVNICICEDGRAQYGLEWYDPNTGNFATEAVTLTELKLLFDNCKRDPIQKKEVGLKTVESK